MADNAGFQLFGWQITKGVAQQSLPSFAPETRDDGAVLIEAQPSVGAFSQTYIDLDNAARSDAELIRRYRDMSLHPEVDTAITQICNELIVTDEEQELVELDLQKADELSPAIKEVMIEVFHKLLQLLEFNTRGWDIVRQWYVDGRIYFHAIIDPSNPKGGIMELRAIDPTCLRKIRNFIRQVDPRTGAVILQSLDEFYLYNEKGFGTQATGTGSMGFGNQMTGIRIAADSIIECTSGMTAGRQVLSYMNKAIKPVNQLRAIEDAAVIYLLVRAPARRVFYVDTGNLPKMQAEQHLRDMMASAKNKLVYDPTTGAIRDDRLQMTMLDDIWLARREGNKSTEIQTLESSGMLVTTDLIEFFLKKLYNALNVPLSRLMPETMYSLGRASEISRDEANFALFIGRLRTRFSMLFLELLERELILQNIIKPEEWDSLRHQIKFKFARENAFAELKNLEIMTDRVNVLMGVMPFVGRFYSNDYVRRTILNQNEEDIEREDKLIAEEMVNPQYRTMLPGEDPMAADGGGPMASGPGSPVAPPTDPDK